MNTKDSKLVSPKRQMWGAIKAPPFKERHTFSRHQLWIRPSQLSHALHVSLSIHLAPQSRSLPNFAPSDQRNRFPRFLAQISQRFPRQGQILFSSNMLVEPVMELHQILFAKLQLFFVVENLQKLQTYVWTPWPAPPVREGNSQWMARERTVK